MYITSTIKTKSSRLAKPVLCLGTLCSAFLTGLNRVSEYRNHCVDVIGGFILGTAVALFLVIMITIILIILAGSLMNLALWLGGLFFFFTLLDQWDQDRFPLETLLTRLVLVSFHMPKTRNVFVSVLEKQ